MYRKVFTMIEINDIEVEVVEEEEEKWLFIFIYVKRSQEITKRFGFFCAPSKPAALLCVLVVSRTQ